MLVGRGDDGVRSVLLGDGSRVVAADRSTNELAQQGPFVPEAGVDGLLRDPGLLSDRGDARALEAAFLEQLTGSIEYPFPRLLSLLATARGAVAARLDISGHRCHGTTVSNTVNL